jgi:hypothetical protein
MQTSCSRFVAAAAYLAPVQAHQSVSISAGWMADVMLVPTHENRSPGSVMEHELKPYCNGTKFSYRWTS